MKYKKNERVYVHYKSQVCEATILEWDIEKPLVGPAEVRYLVHLTYRPDRKKEAREEMDVWIENRAVKKHALHVDETKVHNFIKTKKDGMIRYVNEELKGKRKDSLPQNVDSLKDMFMKMSGYDNLQESVIRSCHFQGVDCPASIANDLEDLMKDCREHAEVLARNLEATENDPEPNTEDARTQTECAPERQIHVHPIFVSKAGQAQRATIFGR